VWPTDPMLLAPVFRARLNAAMRIPVIETAFPRPWTAAARRVLPSPSPQFTATAMWGPLLAWAVLELLAESIDAEKPERMALELFDRLRLREPLGQAFSALGFEGEEAWRVAARIKVVLLSEAGIGKDEARVVEVLPAAKAGAANKEVMAAKTGVGAAGLAAKKRGGSDRDKSERDELRADDAKASSARGPAVGKIGMRTEGGRDAFGVDSLALAPSLWLDPDVRWLTGVHEADGHSYLVRERYEELLWWLLLPSMLRVAAEPALDHKAIARMGELVEEALNEAARAGYRIDALLKPTVDEAIDEDEGVPDPELEKLAGEPELPEGDPVEAGAETGTGSPMDEFEPSTRRR
jgi:hypothetical protein